MYRLIYVVVKELIPVVFLTECLIGALKDWIPVKPPQRGPASRDDTVWGRAGCVSGLGGNPQTAL